MEHLQIDSTLRDVANHKSQFDEFNRFFRFSDGKGITNSSGFRPKSKINGSTNIDECAFCILITTFSELEWPDYIDLETGLFTYFGDKRIPGDLHETNSGGNRFLRSIFNKLHTGDRKTIPPILIFQKLLTAEKHTHMKFLGLAAPGFPGLSAYEDLVAVWRVKGNTRFQNYRSSFTILKLNVIRREWLEELVNNVKSFESQYCPDVWLKWVKEGAYTPLICERKREPRDKQNQLPYSDLEYKVYHRIFDSFSDREFEYAAVEIVQLMDSRFCGFTVTQRVRDGGRDAIGSYKAGHDKHQIYLNAIIEAKLWKETSDIGVAPMSRLISRIKNRDIGVFVTTSCFSLQVQKELIEDNHPIILVSGGDIARVLIANELHLETKFEAWARAIRERSSI